MTKLKRNMKRVCSVFILRGIKALHATALLFEAPVVPLVRILYIMIKLKIQVRTLMICYTGYKSIGIAGLSILYRTDSTGD